MPFRHLSVLALACGLASMAHAAPASELAGQLMSLPGNDTISLQAFTERLRQPVAAAVAPTSASDGYVPRTAHDNSPYRFDMTQNGRRMTAEEFDAWMKARGIRVATGKPAGSEPAAAAPAAATAQACQATTTTTC